MEEHFTVQTKQRVKSWYQQKEIVQKYLSGKFGTPLGELLHTTQVELINKEIQRVRATSVLDIACGPARITAHLQGNFEGIAVDSSEEMLRIARQRLRGDQWKLRKMDAFALGTLHRAFDMVISFRFLRHLNAQERDSFYFRLKKIMHPGTVFIFDAANKYKWEQVRHISTLLGRKNVVKVYDIFYSQSELRRELERNGFTVVKIIPVINHYFTQYAFSKLGKSFLPLLRFFEKIGGRNPWEWVVICKKK